MEAAYASVSDSIGYKGGNLVNVLNNHAEERQVSYITLSGGGLFSALQEFIEVETDEC